MTTTTNNNQRALLLLQSTQKCLRHTRDDGWIHLTPSTFLLTIFSVLTHLWQSAIKHLQTAVVLVLKDIKLGDQLLHPYSLMLSNSIVKATSRIPRRNWHRFNLRPCRGAKKVICFFSAYYIFLLFRSDITFLKDDPMHEWKPHWSEYLDELLFLDGFRGFSNDRCPTCIVHSNNNPPLYRCLDCFIGQPVCGKCCLLAHTSAISAISCDLFGPFCLFTR